jgi:hypothetical protein
MTVKNDTKIIKINVLLTTVLVLITIFYAYQTYRLSNISFKQMILSAEPNIDLESDNFNKLIDGKIKFELINLSTVNLKNIKLYSNYYTHLIDKDLNEFTLYRGVKSFLSDFEIKRIKGNHSASIEFDYSRSGLTNIKSNAYFDLGIPPSVNRYSIKDINKFYNLTYAEYKVEFQREIDGKEYSRTFFYLIALHTNPKEVRLIRTTKEEMLNQNRELARIVKLSESATKK